MGIRSFTTRIDILGFRNTLICIHSLVQKEKYDYPDLETRVTEKPLKQRGV